MTDDTARLKNFPISWFAMIMGMTGFSIAWNRAEHIFDAGFCVSSVLLGVASILHIAPALSVVRREICVEGH